MKELEQKKSALKQYAIVDTNNEGITSRDQRKMWNTNIERTVGKTNTSEKKWNEINRSKYAMIRKT